MTLLCHTGTLFILYKERFCVALKVLRTQKRSRIPPAFVPSRLRSGSYSGRMCERNAWTFLCEVTQNFSEYFMTYRTSRGLTFVFFFSHSSYLSSLSPCLIQRGKGHIPLLGTDQFGTILLVPSWVGSASSIHSVNSKSRRKAILSFFLQKI